MNRKPEFYFLCKLLKEALHPADSSFLSAKEQADAALCLPKILALGRSHGVLVALYDRIAAYPFSIPPTVSFELQQTTALLCQKSYQMLSFAQKVTTLLSDNGIRYHYLKGLTIASCYPAPDYRRYSDIDILITDKKEFARARELFLQNGFTEEKSHVNYHITLVYEKNQIRYLLELHRNIMESVDFDKTNRQILSVFKNIPATSQNVSEGNFSISTLPVTENALHILLHMLNHFLKKGFGIKFLCDWTMYMERYSEQIDKEKFCEYLLRFGLEGFCNAITRLCITYLGLPSEQCSFLLTESLCPEFLETLLEDILDSGEYGKEDASRMLVVTQKGHFLPYFHELHRQMKLRFPKLVWLFLLWPLLWVITGICFLWNNHFVRKVSTKELLKTTQKRQQLAKELNIFR